MTLHSETIMEYARNPQNQGEMKDYTISHKEDNRVCGDDIIVYLKITDNTLSDWSFSGNASMITVACSSLFGEVALGVDIETILGWQQSDIIDMTEITVSPRRKRAQVLALLATRNAIHRYKDDAIQDDFSDVFGE